MREIKQKRKIRRILFSRITIVVLLILLFLLGSATWGVFGKFLETRKNKITAEVRVQDLLERKELLVEDIEYLATERGVEEEVRENFGFVKDGERVVIIVPEKEVEDDGRLRISSFWERLKLFFGRR